jgi:energy-coupling factor transporter ATP-binding protein EcfA2
MNEVMVPQEVRRTGIRKGLLEDLALKILYLQGEMSLVDLSEHTCLGLGVIEEIFQFFRKEQLCEVKGMSGSTHRIIASAQGKQRAADLLMMNQYAGPAPVSLADYIARVDMQSVQRVALDSSDVERAFCHLVMGEDLLARVGASVTSGTSLFLYGPPGTGKTTIATSIPGLYNDTVLVPHAVEVDSQIITVYDPGVHRPSAEPILYESDKRWVHCTRPCVLAGGELSAEMLDLQFSKGTQFYAAPLQMKANNGVLILDDFGRQRMRPDELLNRWMTPLDRRVDFLTLPGGRKFEVPFDLFVVFSTNLDPRELADEAFLRRIPNKLSVDYASPEDFKEVFRRECQVRLLACAEDLPEYLVECITQEMKQPLSHCHARDLINQVFWAARYASIEPRLTRSTLRQACRAHFLSTGKTQKAEESKKPKT